MCFHPSRQPKITFDKIFFPMFDGSATFAFSLQPLSDPK
jgi:hypothetical protein